MKKLSSLFVLLCASVMMFGAESVVKTLDTTGSLKGSNSSYTGNCDVTSDNIIWNFSGNSTMNPWRLGGKSLTNTDRTVYTKTAIVNDISKIEVSHGTASSITVNSFKLLVADNVNFQDALEYTGTFKASATATFTRPEGVSWANKYYKFVYNVTVSGSSNKFVQFSGVKFYSDAEEVHATGITLDKTALSVENHKNTVALTATLTPTNATDPVEWTSSDATVATISAGIITALKEGTTTITASVGEYSATCELTVTAPTVLTCAQAVEIAKAVSANNVKAENGKYVVRGYMTKEAGKGFASDMANYKNITFWMADERGTAQTFEAYQVKPLDAENLPEVGALVEIVGDLTKYNTTYETTGSGSATMRVIENAPLQYELNGGVLASTPAPATTNEALWKLFMPEYNTYYNLNRSEQTIDKVTTFANAKMQEIMTDTKSGWKWLGDYVLSVATAQSYTVDSESTWRWTMHAFFNCSPAASLTVKVAGFDEAGKPEKWIAAWDATHTATLPERPTEATELPVPTREGYVFAGWYNNAEFTGEAITTVDATTKGTLYAKWEVEAIPATAIEMSEIGLNMTVGETFTLTVTVTPEDASLEGLTWTSSDETLATVKDGVVTAVAPTPDYEYVTITATLGELTATCDVAIYAALESIKFNTTEMDTKFEYEEGLEIPLNFDIQPANASTDGIIVTSSNTAVATITEQSFFGMTFFTMNIVGVGTTTLKVTTADGKLSDELVITVTPPAVHATAVTVDKEALTLNVGDTYQLVATMTPEDAVDVIEWNSAKPGVATVENGLVTAVGVGEATIWILAGWEASATCKVTVNDKGTGLENIAELDTNAPIYNVLGQEVSAEYKGVVIQNGKKFLLQ